MAAIRKKSAREEKLSSRRSPSPVDKHKAHQIGGRWKLVYADFVTVLMAFFIVMWIIGLKFTAKTDLKSNSSERARDRTCTNEIAALVREKIQSLPGVDAANPPIKVANDFSVPGVRFTLVDSQEAMFESGKSNLSEFAAPHLDTIAAAVSRCPESHKLRIEGYTDSKPFAGGDSGYGNWELSADRANTARRELLKRGISSARIAEVTGYGDSIPAVPSDPESKLNRRVSITLIAPQKSEPDSETGSSPANAAPEAVDAASAKPTV